MSLGLELPVRWHGLSVNRDGLFGSRREIALPKLTEADALARIGGALTPLGARLCVIPDNDAEALCYEVRATSGSDTFLAYIDAMTGVERRLMQVVESDGGAKVM